jgi:hypothetical protein
MNPDRKESHPGLRIILSIRESKVIIPIDAESKEIIEKGQEDKVNINPKCVSRDPHLCNDRE